MSFSVYRPPGTYEAGLWLPNVGTFVQQFDVSGPLELALDLVTTTVSGTVTLNGAPITSPDCSSTVVFAGSISSGFAPIHCDGTGWTFSGVIQPGDYDVRIQGAGLTIPVQGPVLAHVSIPPAGLTGLQVDANPVTISGTITLNGAPIAQGCKDAIIMFDGRPGENRIAFGAVDCTGGTWTFKANVYPGTYAVSVNTARLLPGSDNPEGGLQGEQVATGVDFRGPAVGLNFDVKAIFISGSITENGLPFPSPCKGTLQIGDVRFAVTCDAGGLRFSGAVPPGRAPVTLDLREWPVRSSLIGSFTLAPPIDF